MLRGNLLTRGVGVHQDHDGQRDVQPHTVRRILEVLDGSVNGHERDCQGPHRRLRLETLGNNDNNLKQYGNVGLEDAKS